MYCPRCGNTVSDQASFCERCGFALKSVVVEPAKIQSQSATPFQASYPSQTISFEGQTIAATRYAGFWIRLVADIIDTVILNIASFVVLFVIGFVYGFVGYTAGFENIEQSAESLGVLLYPISFFLNWLYYSLFESSAGQATLGKRALGLKVINLEGNRISFGKASLRWVGRIISGLIIGIGFLLIAFNEKKQGLHDVMAGTLVVKK